MLKLKYFDPKNPNHDEEFNSFIAGHAPRNTKNSPGIVLNQNGLYVFYEDGDSFSKSEMVAEIKEMLRSKQYEILVGEPMIRLKKAETEKFKTLLADIEEAISHGTQAKGIDAAAQKSQLKQTIEANEAWLLTNGANQENAREQIAYLKNVLADIEAGNWTV